MSRMPPLQGGPNQSEVDLNPPSPIVEAGGTAAPLPPPQTGAPMPAPRAAAGGRPGSAESAHFRIDEHERRLTALEGNPTTSPDHIAGLVSGAAAAVHGSLQAELAKVLAAQARDQDTDRAVVEAIRELVEELKAHRGLIATGQGPR